MRLPAQGRCAGAARCATKPRLCPSSVPERIRFPPSVAKYSKTKPRRLAPARLLIISGGKGTIAARLPAWTNRRVLALASARPLRRRGAVRHETPAPPLVRAGEDPIPSVRNEVFKNKAPLACAGGALIISTGKITIAARLPEWTNRRVLALASARPLRRRGAVRHETPAPPLVRAGEDSIPSVRSEVFKNKAPPACAGGALFLNTGGGGGNRTLVRKHSTDSSTYLALSFNLTSTTGMCTLCTSELP